MTNKFVIFGVLLIAGFAIVWLSGANPTKHTTTVAGPVLTETVEVAVPGPLQTETVVRVVNPPVTPKPRGAAAAPPPKVTGTITAKGPWPGYVTWFFAWQSVPVAISYRLWIDGKVTGEQTATPGETQGITFSARCGVAHTFNLQVRNAAGVYGAKRSTPTTFTPNC